MEILLTDLCRYVHNYFLVRPNGIHKGTFIIDGRELTCDFLKTGQFFRVYGSLFNDGVWKYPAKDMINEEFEGEIWAMAVPPEVMLLLDDVAAWQEKFGGLESPNYSPYTSESFNNYSYSKGSRTGDTGHSAAPMTWKDAFADRIQVWRRLP